MLGLQAYTTMFDFFFFFFFSNCHEKSKDKRYQSTLYGVGLIISCLGIPYLSLTTQFKDIWKKRTTELGLKDLLQNGHQAAKHSGLLMTLLKDRIFRSLGDLPSYKYGNFFSYLLHRSVPLRNLQRCPSHSRPSLELEWAQSQLAEGTFQVPQSIT